MYYIHIFTYIYAHTEYTHTPNIHTHTHTPTGVHRLTTHSKVQTKRKDTNHDIAHDVNSVPVCAIVSVCSDILP